MKLNIFSLCLFGVLLHRSWGCSRNENNDKDEDCTAQIHFPVVDSGIPEYPFMMSVYGIPMFATSKWSAEKLNHVGSILAELLDQDEDGCADDQLVLTEILEARESDDLGQGAVLLPTKEDDADSGIPIIEAAGYFVATIEAEDETRPDCTGLNFTHRCSDASIEELFHLVTSLGHYSAYPSIFRTDYRHNSTLTDAVDVARGGRFKDIPIRYPESAWYTYYDPTCEYSCQATEYIWWGYCAFSGVCEGRSGASWFEDEFRYLTKAQFVEGDVKLSKLFQDSGSTYILPTTYVDGKYHGCKTCPDGPDHGGV